MGQPTPIAGVSPAIQAVINRALEKDPEKRYGQAREMIEALRKAAGNTSSPVLRFNTSHRKTFAVTGAGALIIAASVALGMYVSHAYRHELPPVPTAAAATLTTPAPPSSGFHSR